MYPVGSRQAIEKIYEKLRAIHHVVPEKEKCGEGGSLS